MIMKTQQLIELAGKKACKKLDVTSIYFTERYCFEKKERVLSLTVYHMVDEDKTNFTVDVWDWEKSFSIETLLARLDLKLKEMNKKKTTLIEVE